MNESINSREPMGKVIFKDGHSEPIVFYRMFNVEYVQFFTENAAYSYEHIGDELKFFEHVVSIMDDQWDDMWVIANEISNIELY